MDIITKYESLGRLGHEWLSVVLMVYVISKTAVNNNVNNRNIELSINAEATEPVIDASGNILEVCILLLSNIDNLTSTLIMGLCVCIMLNIR